MKAEAKVFGIATVFFGLVAPLYWFMSKDPTGTSALTMTALLGGMVALYLGVHAAKMDARPEDRNEGEIAEGAGELGFFPPYSWWPLWCALALGVIVYGVALAAWWMVVMGFAFGAITLSGFVFEYYRGEHAH